jgi:hypothetical protein
VATIEILYDEKTRLGYVWLVWALTPERCDLVAIATSEEKRDAYLTAGSVEFPGAKIHAERAWVDHVYGRGMLQAMNTARLRRSETGGYRYRRDGD